MGIDYLDPFASVDRLVRRQEQRRLLLSIETWKVKECHLLDSTRVAAVSPSLRPLIEDRLRDLADSEDSEALRERLAQRQRQEAASALSGIVSADPAFHPRPKGFRHDGPDLDDVLKALDDEGRLEAPHEDGDWDRQDRLLHLLAWADQFASDGYGDERLPRTAPG